MGIGTFTQINGISSATNNFFHGKNGTSIHIFENEYSLVTIITGIIITLFVALVIIGGIKNISNVSQIIVPFMAVMYILCALIIVFTHIDRIPDVISQIIGGAFGIKPLEGATLGTTIFQMKPV